MMQCPSSASSCARLVFGLGVGLRRWRNGKVDFFSPFPQATRRSDRSSAARRVTPARIAHHAPESCVRLRSMQSAHRNRVAERLCFRNGMLPLHPRGAVENVERSRFEQQRMRFHAHFAAAKTHRGGASDTPITGGESNLFASPGDTRVRGDFTDEAHSTASTRWMPFVALAFLTWSIYCLVRRRGTARPGVGGGR